MSGTGAGAAHIALGLLNAKSNQIDKAADCFREAIRLEPGSAQAHDYLGIALIDLGQPGEAIDALERAMAADPALVGVKAHLAAAVKARGAELRETGRITDAADLFARAAALDPADAEAHYRHGVMSFLLHRYPQALASLEVAAELDPAAAQIRYNLGITLVALRRPSDALAAFDQALTIDPDHALARNERMFLNARECDWAAIDADAPDIAAMGIEGPALPPFAMLPLEDDPPRHRQRSERYIAALNLPQAPVPARPTSRPDRLRIGYFSADFRNHATMHLAGRMFGLHDRARFCVHGYALGSATSDAVRRRVSATFDSFADVDHLDDQAIAALARADGIDLAIDMLGYTDGSRPGIFAARAAPLQLSFLGFPGTSGAPFIDYLIVDPIVIPDAERAAYSECLLRLPHSYQVNDDQRTIAPITPTRREAGLPEQGFVFCCFNNINKIKPTEFAIWMRLLGEVEGSVLWLLAGSETSRTNLRKAAEWHGVDPSRLVFASPVPLDQHLARHRLADLFLDTFHYNAHTTASDALWAGLPLVTRAGRGFAARVAASLLHAVGLDQLITSTDEDYHALARDLAIDPARLAEIRGMLASNRLTRPLFDTALFVRHIEAGYEAAYQRWFDREAPTDINVAP